MNKLKILVNVGILFFLGIFFLGCGRVVPRMTRQSNPFDLTSIFVSANPPSTKSIPLTNVTITSSTNSENLAHIERLSITMVQGVNENGILKTRAVITGSVTLKRIPNDEVIILQFNNNQHGAIVTWQAIELSTISTSLTCGVAYPFEVVKHFDLALFVNTYEVRVFNRPNEWSSCQ